MMTRFLQILCFVLLLLTKPQANALCPLEDEPGVVVNNLTCAQIPSCFCYQEEVANKCCKTCADRKINQPGCLYGDKVCNGCDETLCGTELKPEGSYSFMCCQTCQNVQCRDRISISADGDPTSYPCNEFLSRTTKTHHCYESAYQINCCITCENLRNKTRQDCIFGDDSRRINCANLLTLTRNCNEDEEVKCCDTCAIKRELAKTTTPPPPTTTPPPTPGVTECCSGVSIQATLVLLFDSFLFTVWGNPVN